MVVEHGCDCWSLVSGILIAAVSATDYSRKNSRDTIASYSQNTLTTQPVYPWQRRCVAGILSVAMTEKSTRAKRLPGSWGHRLEAS